ncbi:LemA family protein [Desulfonatronospira thiodismutans ASO3-1]|uniref:LemA family protein n=1 Tax=Desulfonatronospira thiodismutans ASO3-1 TaxID=555779 RepID=D6SMA7_9BACT|nr:LemA family protein [Desulfonatronospira thiodismutans]EFI35818.1 LemA family protein [Desulfonatronospira thiodismutans ASO3-1]
MSSIAWIVPVLLLAFFIFYMFRTYNHLIKLKNRYQNAFSQIDVQLKRRYDLIPNLVETARSYMQHERETLENVIKARNQALEASKQASSDPGEPDLMQKLSGAEGLLSGSLGRLFALAENYPDLKANQNMMQLSEELTSTENKISFARQAYNDAVMAYNTYKQSMPQAVFAPAMGFKKASFLEFDREEIKEVPKVSFS